MPRQPLCLRHHKSARRRAKSRRRHKRARQPLQKEKALEQKTRREVSTSECRSREPRTYFFRILFFRIARAAGGVRPFPESLHFLTLSKLPTSLIRLPLRLPGDGFLSTPSRGVLHAFHPVSQVCLSGLLHGDFCALLCSAACSSTGRRAAIFRYSRRQSCPRFRAAGRES